MATVSDKKNGKGPIHRTREEEIALFGDFVCMRGGSLAVYEMEKLAMPGKDGNRTATTTAHDNRDPRSYGVFGGSEILVDAAPGKPQEKRQEVFVHPDSAAKKTEPPLPSQPDPVTPTTPDSAADAVFDDPDIIIDDKSGISVEEQREILAQINGISDKNRRAFSAGSKKRFKAKKSGGLFPVLVNAFAIAALIGGFIALYTFQTGIYEHAREGTRTFNPTERAIIEEIRRETAGLLGIKNLEIAILTSFLADVEAQMELIAGQEALTQEQQYTYENLRIRQEELRAELAVAQEERSRILNEARVQETILHAHFNTRMQVEAQLQEFAAAGESPPPETLAAHEQLLAQQEEFHATLVTVREERSRILSEAREREAELQEQLGARALIETRLMELIADDETPTPEQLAVYEQLMAQREELSDAMETTWDERARLLYETREQEAELQAHLDAGIYDFDLRAYMPDSELDALNEEFAQLFMEQTHAERVEALIANLFASTRRQIAESRFYEVEETIASLRGILNDPTFLALRTVQPRRELYVQATDAIETLLARYQIAQEAIRTGVLPPDRDAEIRLEQEIARLVEELAAMENIVTTIDIAEANSAQFIAQLENTINNLQSTNAALNSQVGNLQSANATLNSQVGNLQSANATLNSQVGNLQSANTALNSQVGNLQSANATLNSQVDNLQSANATLNSQVGNLQSANAALNSQIGNLQLANTALDSQVGNLQSENATLNEQMGTLQENLNTQTQAVQSLSTVNVSLNNQLTELRQALANE